MMMITVPKLNSNRIMEFGRFLLLLILNIAYEETHHAMVAYKTKCLKYYAEKPHASCTGINDQCKQVQICNKDNSPCFNMFRNNSSVLTPMYAGCHIEETCENNVKQCILKHHSYDQPLMFSCCCIGDMCNLDYIINATHMKMKTQYVHPTRKPYRADITATHEPPKDRILYYILIPLFGFVIVIAVLISLWRKHKNSIRRRTPLLRSTPPPTPPLMSKPIQMHEVISRGQFGCVWRATYEHCEVAVKIIQQHERASWETERKMYSEYKLMDQNILRFHSAEKRIDNGLLQYWIVTEYHTNGSLADYLHKSILNYETLMTLTLSMVKGLAYLHKENIHAVPFKPIIAHRDFKSRNVLVKSNLSCCISDFGSACALLPGVENDAAKAQIGTKRYMSPEMLEGAVGFQNDSFLCIDIYALALVLWECLSRTNMGSELVEPYRAPYEEFVGAHPTIDKMTQIVLHQKQRPFLKEEWRNHEKLHEYCTAIEDCWDADSEARLSADCIYERLSVLVGDDVVPSPHSVKLSNKHICMVELSDSKPVLNLSSSTSEDTVEDSYPHGQSATENTFV